MFVGDFNLPGINWEAGSARGGDEALLEMMQDRGFVQMVDFPTHTKGNLLDLVVTNIPGKVSNICDMGRLGTSDHVIIQFDLALGAGPRMGKKMVTDWKRAGWTKIKEGLENTRWPVTGDNTSTEEAWGHLRDVLERLVADNVPKREFKLRKSDWMSGDLLREIRKKRRLWKMAKNGVKVQEYADVAKKVKKMIRTAKRGMEKRLAANKVDNKRPFYNYVKKKTKARVGIGPLKKGNGEMTQDDEEMAEELNNFFSSVFTREDKTNMPDLPEMRTRTKLTSSFITAGQVKQKIKELKPHSAAGPDVITPRLLQACQEELSPVLAMIFRKSINSRQVPQEWRQANVVLSTKRAASQNQGTTDQFP